MSRKRTRSPALAALLLVIVLVLALRSLWVSDVLRWRSIDDSDHRSLIPTTIGLRSARLGLGFFYDQRIFSTGNARDVDAALASPGPSYLVEPLPASRSLARAFGFGYERIVDERPESFRNSFELAIPLWLIAMLLGIGPVRWLMARRAVRVARLKEAGMNDAAAPRPHDDGRRSTMKIAIALALGLVIGAAVVYVAQRAAAPPTTAPAAAVTPAPADDKPPIHPIVGMWRIRMDSIRATYQVANDGSFVVTFTGLPHPPTEPQVAHDAGGTWRVNGKELVLTNAWSSTPLVVVGERETATIVSVEPELLKLEHADRKGRSETLVFERRYPFVKGRTDKPAIVGRWRSPSFTLDLKPGGDATITSSNASTEPRSGAWSQTAKILTLVMDPPYVKSAARRAAHPHLTEPREQVYEIRHLDELRLILHDTDTPPTENVVFERVASGASGAPAAGASPDPRGRR